jgi:putative oxidoreductase
LEVFVTSNEGQTKLVIPALGCVYRCPGCFVNPFLRVVFAALVAPSGFAKLTDPDFAAQVHGLIGKLGFSSPDIWFYLIVLLETAGSISLAFGFLTRLVAGIFVIEMLVIAIGVHLPTGHGYQYPFLLAAVALTLTLRGGGRWSIDRLIGREL